MGPTNVPVGGGRARAGVETTRIALSTTGPTGVEGAGGSGGHGLQCPWAVAGPGYGARGRWQGQGGPRNEANRTQHNRPHWCGGRRRDRRARAGFEIDHSEPSGSRVAISRAAGPSGARNTSGATSKKTHPQTCGNPAPQIELPPVSWTSKLKSREWEAFRVCGSGVEA